MSCSLATALPSAGCCTGEIVRRLDSPFAKGDLDDAERQTVRKLRDQQRHGHVVHRDVALRPSLERAAVRVAVTNGLHAVAVERLVDERSYDGGGDLPLLP